MIRFACEQCQERLVVPEQHAGRKGKCPKCGAVARVPQTSQFPEPHTSPLIASSTHGATATATSPPPGATGPAAAPRAPGDTARPGSKPAAQPIPPQRTPLVSPAPSSPAPAIAPEADRIESAPRREGFFDRAMRRREEKAWVDGTAPYDLDAAGMPPVARLMIVLAIVVGLIAAIWVVVYLIIWAATRGAR